MTLPLVIVWPYAPVFWLVCLWASWPERRLSRRSRSTAGPQDAESATAITVGMRVSGVAAFALAFALPAAGMPAPPVLFWAGVATIAAASLLRRHCFRMLGTSFTGAVVVAPGQAIVELGAYRWVRHPAYTASALLFAGIGLALGNWASLVTLLVAVVIVYAYRVSVEERALLNALGDPYRQYARRTKRFVPFLF
jgi:protein-S-isoprenylcysteine O-methyltransferase Ste14